MRELNNIKIIAVDHGYGNIKTANTVTPTGVTAYEQSRSFSETFWSMAVSIIASGKVTRNLLQTRLWMRTITF